MQKKIRTNNIMTVLLAVVLLMLVAPTMAADWQQFQYDIANTGNSPADAPDDNTTKWITADIGAVEGSQAMIIGDRVFVYADTEVYALNKDTGGIHWSTVIWGDTSGFGSWASPAYSDGKLFVSSGYNISRINAADGTLEQLVSFPDGGHSCNGGPTVADGVVYAGSGYGSPAHYYAFDASDLTTTLWSFSVGSDVAGSTPAVAGDRVVFGNGSSLTCVNEASGALTWTTDLSSGTVLGSAAIDSANDRVYVATGSGGLALLHALDLNGNLIWTSTTSIDFTDGTPAFLDMDHVYISGNAYSVPGHTYCFNGTGVLQWTVDRGSWVMSPAVADGKLFTGDCDDMGGWGFFEGIGAYDALTGALIWEYDYGGSSPSVANPDDMVVSIGKNGVVYAFGDPFIPTTPFIISGNVSRAEGMPCNDPSVLITNTGTGEDWNAETFPALNYYQLVLGSDDVSEGDVLAIEASGCSQSNTTVYTVSQAEIDIGGFELNITLEGPGVFDPVITSCNDTGAVQDGFCPGDSVWVNGTGLAPNTEYKLWIQPDPVNDSDTLNASVDPSGSQETVTTDAEGNFGQMEIWSAIPAGSPMNYDIVVDDQDGVYNEASDGIDSANGVVGIVAPIPELATIALFAVGLVMLLGYMRLGRRD